EKGAADPDAHQAVLLRARLHDDAGRSAPPPEPFVAKRLLRVRGDDLDAAQRAVPERAEESGHDDRREHDPPGPLDPPMRELKRDVLSNWAITTREFILFARHLVLLSWPPSDHHSARTTPEPAPELRLAQGCFGACRCLTESGRIVLVMVAETIGLPS